ncbi:MAG: HU family DNA-binding protein [Candidatus Diapherotrites archaeon]|nr:HU family DNA-binding protein [Candidatus Diapherotrites archaeon]
MNKGELIERIAREQKITKKKAAEVVDSVLSTIVSSVKKGDEVRLVGFGTFYRAKRNARTGVNPQTGARMKIPAKKVPKFRAGAAFKSAVS